jgi:hypothetical protein
MMFGKIILDIIERSVLRFQENENLSVIEFKIAIEYVGKRQPMLVKLMLASWEFEQFIDIYKVKP